ncbi:MAG: ATP-binding cassette domain-containing protein [Methanomassiliicoccus sp.]|nr:MAG: ATP-binding cassette domain-containing protein [Methanomassiliicoccus sp.]
MREDVWSGVTSCFELRKVRVTLNGNQVITRGDVEVREGELLMVVGPSGAGKSTLLRCLNRLTDITTGEISFFGVPLHDIDPITLRRRVGMLFQIVVFSMILASGVSTAVLSTRLMSKELFTESHQLSDRG